MRDGTLALAVFAAVALLIIGAFAMQSRADVIASVDQIQCDAAPFVEVPRCPGSTSLLPAQACPGGRFVLLTMHRCRREGMAHDFVTVEERPWEPEVQKQSYK